MKKIKPILNKLLEYVKSLKWSVLIGLAVLCFILAIVNNIRVDETKSVDWIGSQEVMPKPDEVL